MLSRPSAPGVHELVRPVTPLSDAALLTNTRGGPTLNAELRSELTSADQVDLLCAFIRWHGIRLLEAELDVLHERGVPFRVITTTYMGATEQRAVDELVRRHGAELKISYARAEYMATVFTRAGIPSLGTRRPAGQFFTIWPDLGGFDSYEAGLRHLRSHPAVCVEIRELTEHTLDQARHLPKPLGEGMQQVPLYSHAHYRREEILAALDWASTARKARGHATGVVWAPEVDTDALLVNLRKTERDFSPTTMYRDFALSPSPFHWESQNATSVGSGPGQRYLGHRERGTHVALFVREMPSDDIGSAPFLCLGLCDYVEHQGERPIAITWKLRRDMPGETFQTASVVAS